MKKWPNGIETWLLSIANDASLKVYSKDRTRTNYKRKPMQAQDSTNDSKIIIDADVPAFCKR